MNKCNNCGKSYHIYKHCKSPITSIGIININEKKQYLMICRKKTLGYVDFIKGKYALNDLQHINNLIDEMTMEEKRCILETPFLELWEDLWGIKVKLNACVEESTACEKFNKLRQGYQLDTRILLSDLVKNSSTSWTEPEWGFPKGRKNNYESDIMCAYREYEEETGYCRRDLNLIKNILPYEEIFTGSNYKSYKHKYFIARSDNSSQKHEYQENEVSDLQWFTYEEAMSKIRDYNVERKEVLTMIHSMLEDYV
jgi:8-oxo-dGTP pyrophosphatase MutT (NUDIX family)